MREPIIERFTGDLDRRVNLGAYGNTSQASMKASATGVLLIVW